MEREIEYPDGEPFPGVIGRTLSTSTAAWPVRRRPPRGSPNVLFILLDDVGFAQLGCFGADIDTPNLDRLANRGLRYRNFHTAAMCTPSRACLLSGRNHHANGAGTVGAAGFPGYNGTIPDSNGFLSEILRERGFATFAVGKWHLAPANQCAPGSPKNQWPLGQGFDRFYGFLGGTTDQFCPEIVHDNHFVEPWRGTDDGYHLNSDMADRAIEFLTDLRAVDTDKPFFLYYCPGAGHSPHQVPRAWADRYRSRFDGGWDLWRQQTFERQREIGIVPEQTQLTPRPEWVSPWDELGPDDRRLFARQMEVYAGFLTHTDHYIGKVLAFLEELGELDNTLLIVASDNGASSEGGPRGFPSPWTAELASVHSASTIDGWGQPHTAPHYAWGWAWAGNTPFQRWKRWVHEGGVADPLIVHWPDGIDAQDAIRGQYAHAIDVAPTVFDVLGIEPADVLDGIPQSHMHGVSFAHTFDDPGAPTKKMIQYYEMMGSRAIWKQGWKAVTAQEQGPELTEEHVDSQRWELYCVDEDFSESIDLATEHPDKLRELVDLWWAEAGKYGVLPLDARRPRTEWSGPARNHVVFRPGGGPIPGGFVPSVHGRSHVITASVEIPTGAEGVILAQGGGYHGGYTIYVKDGFLHYLLRAPGGEVARVTSGQRLPLGTLSLELRSRMSIDGQDVAMLVNDREVGRRVMRDPQPGAAYRRASLTCGYDGGLAVSDDYQSPFRFTGKINWVTVSVGTEGDDQ